MNQSNFLSVFGSVFEQIKATFPFENKRDFLQFEKYYQSQLVKVERIEIEADFFDFLKKFVAGLRNSHTRIGGAISQSYKPRDYEVLLLENKFILRKGKNIFGEILSVCGNKLEDLLKEATKSISGSTKQYLVNQGLKFILLAKEERSANITLKVGKKIINKKLKRIPINNQVLQKIIEHKLLPGNIGYLKIKSWIFSEDNVKKINLIIKSFAAKNIAGLIIDVRDNAGGNSNLADELASHFFIKKTLFGASKRRVNKNNFKLKKFYYHIYPQEPFLSMPIAILTNAQSFSATELFVAGMKDYKKAIIIGEATGGGTGNPQRFEIALPNHKINLFVSTWNYYRPDGQMIEGRGIKPDIMVGPTISSYKNNRDLALTAALKTLRKS